MDKLKPYPFCGGNAWLYETVKGEILYYVVVCSICESQTTWYENKENATKAWNRRVGD